MDSGQIRSIIHVWKCTQYHACMVMLVHCQSPYHGNFLPVPSSLAWIVVKEALYYVWKYMLSLTCMWMLVLHKPASFTSSLTLSNSPLDQVSSFKYLGITLTANLSCSPHIISMVCRNLFKIIGLLYRNFYLNSSPQLLLKLYKALVLPHLTYCYSGWPPRSLPNV